MPEDEYEQLCEEQATKFREYVALFFAGMLTLSTLRQRMESGLQSHFISLMYLGLNGRSLTSRDLAWLQARLDREYTQYLDGFMEDLRNGSTSEARAIWRAGLYGYSRDVYIRYTIPADVADFMPVLPGDDCLGGDLCRCHLEVEVYENDVFVYWIVDPAAESCEVCLSHAIESPYIFTFEDRSG